MDHVDESVQISRDFNISMKQKFQYRHIILMKDVSRL